MGTPGREGLRAIANARNVASVDFLIIGAQKAGTTSLFEYMRRHPEIHMPPEKEIAFFDSDQAYMRGFDWYRERVTRNALPGAVCGAASVGYMTGTPHRDIPLKQWNAAQLRQDEEIEEIIPLRIRAALPHVRLLSVLRDPVERAFSQYRMAVLDGLESQSFDVAISRLLEPAAMLHSRAVATGHNGYVARGEYGRILAGFLGAFPREQLMVIFPSELSHAAQDTLPAIFDFVGVKSDFVPDNRDKRYREAAVQQRIPGLNLNLWQTRLARVPPAQTLWHRMPLTWRGAISRSASLAGYRVELWNAQRDRDGDQMSSSVRKELIAHFLADSEALSALLRLDVPWLAEWQSI